MSRVRDVASTIGKDIKFDFDSMDISIEGSGIQIVDGRENLSQAISLRLMTPFGTIPFHPTYGSALTQLLGRGQSPGIEQVARMMVGQAIIRERRVIGTEEIVVSQAGNTIRIRIIVYSEDEQPVSSEVNI